MSFERVHYNFCCFRILIPDIRKCPFVHDHKWIKSNGGVSWEEGGQLGRSLCGQSDRKVTLFAISMNDDAQKQTVNFWSKCDYLCMDNMTELNWTRTDRSIKVFFFGKRKFVGSVHIITLNMTLIANETEPCLEPLWREDRWRPRKERSGAGFSHCGWIMSRARKALSKCHDQGIQINAVPKEKRIFMPSSVSVASLERISWDLLKRKGGLTGNDYCNVNFFKRQVHFRISISIWSWARLVKKNW